MNSVTQQRANTILYHYSVGIVRAIGQAKYTHSGEEHNKNRQTNLVVNQVI